MSPKNINGPISIAQVTGKAIENGFAYYIKIIALISISLGVMNLLPILLLDGGHLLSYALEAIIGKPVSDVLMRAGYTIGLFLLFGVMSLAFYNDIFRLMH